VTKAAIYHQYNTKDEIILAVAQVVLARLEVAVTSAEAERTRSRAREVLIAEMIEPRRRAPPHGERPPAGPGSCSEQELALWVRSRLVRRK